MNSSKDGVVLQQGVPLSKCQLWDMQKTFFSRQASNSWQDKSLYYSTNNPYLANTYAQVIVRFMQDCLNQPDYHRLEPFYILELGAGTGMLGFYVLKRLIELRNMLNMAEIPMLYVMTDFSMANIHYWSKHPALLPYVKQGLLDFALYDMEQGQALQLINSKRVFAIGSSINSKNPLIVLANDIFNTIRHDVFNFAEGKLQEGIVDINASNKVADSPQSDEPSIDFSYRPVDPHYYNDSKLDAILAYYLGCYLNTCLPFPIGSLRCVQYLDKLSDHKLLLLASAKGFYHDLENPASSSSYMDWHGRFAMPVNFHAIGQYFKLSDGDVYYQSSQHNMTTCAFVLGKSFQQLPEVKHALIHYIDQYSANNIHSSHTHFQSNSASCSIDTITAYLHLTQYDPQFFNQNFKYIMAQLETSSKDTIKNLVALLPKLADNFYYLPDSSNTLYNIGTLLQCLEHYPLALAYYRQAMHYQPPSFHLYLNQGKCCFLLEDYAQAVELFTKALRLDPQAIKVYAWLDKAKKAHKKLLAKVGEL